MIFLADGLCRSTWRNRPSLESVTSPHRSDSVGPAPTATPAPSPSSSPSLSPSAVPRPSRTAFAIRPADNRSQDSELGPTPGQGLKVNVNVNPQPPGPGFLVPPTIQHLDPLMQNLLMGRWPVPPKAESRNLRIFVAAEESDSEVERVWLTKYVFPKLRNYTETLSFHLHVLDLYGPHPCKSLPDNHLARLARQAMEDHIDIWLIILGKKLGWRLPTTIQTEHFDSLRERLAASSKQMASRLIRSYSLDSNRQPPAYALIPQSEKNSTSLEERKELFDALTDVVTDDEDDLYMNEGFVVAVSTALAHHSAMLDNVLVIKRQIINLPGDKQHPACRRYLDINSNNELQPQLQEVILALDSQTDSEQKLQVLTSNVERTVKSEHILKYAPSQVDMEAALRGEETSYVRTLCGQVHDKLKAIVSRLAERQASPNPYLAAGLPPVLCHELLVQAHRRQEIQDLWPCLDTSFINKALDALATQRSQTLVVRGWLGSGLQMTAAWLSTEAVRRDHSRMVCLRYMMLTPESQTIHAVLHTILELVALVFSGSDIFEELKDLNVSGLIAAIGTITQQSAVTIILCHVAFSRLDSEETGRWINEKLPPSVQVIILTTCPKLLNKLILPYLDIPFLPEEELEPYFYGFLKAQGRTITEQQHKLVMASLKESPVPLMASMLADLAVEWTSSTMVQPADMPNTVDECLDELLKQAKAAVGDVCATKILGYISVAKFGLSDSELEDVLAIDDELMSSLYPTSLPIVRRCPLYPWLYLKSKFSSIMIISYAYGHRVYRWTAAFHGFMLRDLRVSEPLMHTELSEFFRGIWVTAPKPLPDPKDPKKKVALSCAVMSQPDSYGKVVNSRKFLCLLHHMLQAHNKVADDERFEAAKNHLLDLRWLIMKLEATSLVQLLDDLQVAVTQAKFMGRELSWLRQLVACSSIMLNVSGRQLLSKMREELQSQDLRRELRGMEKFRRRSSFCSSIATFQVSLSKMIMPFLVVDDVFGVLAASRVSQPARPLDLTAAKPPVCLNGFFLVDKAGMQVVSLSTEGGQLVVWDTVEHHAVKLLPDVNKPTNLVFLDEERVVVLCNRQLMTYSLDSSKLINSIPGMLNLKMPYFHVRDAQTVIMLARNRMSVNILDVNTCQIHATFKAGEDRFLNSLLVSGNGRILVCGDETQKPFPLLVWELGQSKLLHDLRMAQHEFLTHIADITHDGHYLVCACRGLYDKEMNFIVVYDLISGQLYRQFRLAASVTTVAVTSSTLLVVMTLNDGSMAVFDIPSGSKRTHVDGVKAVYNRLQLSSEEKTAVSYSVDAGHMPIACTLSLWDVTAGLHLASYTFGTPITCCQLLQHNLSLLVGLASIPSYVVLRLYDHSDQETSFEESESLWRL